MKIQLLTNPQYTKIVLRCSQPPSEKDAFVLKTLGFVAYLKLPNEFWSPYHTRLMDIARQCKEALESGTSLTSVHFSPTVIASEESMRNRQYSIVTYQLTGRQKDQYILFESFKGIATVIANRFGKSEFGDRLLGTTVQPRASIYKARELFEAGRILEPKIDQVPEPAISTSHAKTAQNLFERIQKGLLYLFGQINDFAAPSPNPILHYLESNGRTCGLNSNEMRLSVRIDECYELRISLYGPDGFIHDLFEPSLRYALVGADGDESLYRIKCQSLWYFLFELAELWRVSPTQVCLYLHNGDGLLAMDSQIGDCPVEETPFNLLLNAILSETESILRQPKWMHTSEPN